MGVAGRRVLITGASRGIGLACAEAFAREGCDLVLSARGAESLEAARAGIEARHGVSVATHAADLSDPAAREGLHAAHPRIDILVNNAGAIPAGTLDDLPLPRWLEAWNLKVFGYIHLCRLYLPRMEAEKGGAIVNVIGMAGRAPRADYVCGAAGNAALIAFTAALGGRSTDRGVRVVGVSPGATRTERIVRLSKERARTRFGDEGRWEEMLNGLPLSRPAHPEEIADLVVFCAGPRGGYLSGTTVEVDGGAQFRG